MLAPKPYQIGLLVTHKNGDFCNGAKVRLAHLKSGELLMGKFSAPLFAV